MTTSIAATVIKVAPLTFNVTINTADIRETAQWRRDLLKRHSCVYHAEVQSGFQIPGVKGLVNEIKITLDEDADYLQICALRAELKA